MASTVKLKELELHDLIDYERAAHLICAKYETLNKLEPTPSPELNEKFSHAREKYTAIIDEIERRVEEVK
jgi:hypothetical protein